MKPHRKPLNRSILIACVLFITMLCILLSLVSYLGYRSSLYDRYADSITDILRYAASGIDADDLAECIRTGEKSEKYLELQRFLDGIKENVSLHYLYVIVPLNTDETDNVMNVIAAATEYEYQHEPDELVQLGALTGDDYSPEAAKKYLDAYRSGTLSFFEERSEWGDDYTGLLPLFDSAGEPVAALCADVEISEIHSALRTQTLIVVLLTVLLGALFTALFIVWTGANITQPIRKLESGVTALARNSQDPNASPDSLVLRIPPIRTENEVQSLAEAVEKMSEAMRRYVLRITSTQKELEAMNILAHRDPLTHVGNKAAFEQYVETLKVRLRTEQPEFAVVIADANGLKRINDAHGHEKGDAFLRGVCKVLCETYHHSPVFRIGGDEFAVFLLGRDYLDRNHLLQTARSAYARAETDERREPWERSSAALGMAVYRRKSDRDVSDVVNRADSAMYAEKSRMKAAAIQGA